MRTNIVIDEELIAQAIAVSGAKTKREAVEMGLRALVEIKGQAAVKKLRGKVAWQGDLEAMRRDR